MAWERMSVRSRDDGKVGQKNELRTVTVWMEPRNALDCSMRQNLGKSWVNYLNYIIGRLAGVRY